VVTLAVGAGALVFVTAHDEDANEKVVFSDLIHYERCLEEALGGGEGCEMWWKRREIRVRAGA
jgi:hypothetical protein